MHKERGLNRMKTIIATSLRAVEWATGPGRCALSGLSFHTGASVRRPLVAVGLSTEGCAYRTDVLAALKFRPQQGGVGLVSPYTMAAPGLDWEALGKRVLAGRRLEVVDRALRVTVYVVGSPDAPSLREDRVRGRRFLSVALWASVVGPAALAYRWVRAPKTASATLERFKTGS